MIKPTILVSFPQSGHDVLIRAIQIYFGDELKYRDPTKDRPGDWNLRKTYDFHGGDPIYGDVRYLVLVRNPAHAIFGRLDQMRAEGSNVPPGSALERTEAKYYANCYCQFLNRWVLSPLPAVRRVLTYDRLIDVPEYSLVKVIEFMTGKKPDDYSKCVRFSSAVRSIAEHPPSPYGQGLVDFV